MSKLYSVSYSTTTCTYAHGLGGSEASPNLLLHYVQVHIILPYLPVIFNKDNRDKYVEACNLVVPISQNANYVNEHTNEIYKHIDQDGTSTKSAGGTAHISPYSGLFDMDVVIDTRTFDSHL
jgi:hypothetical protein